MEVVPLRVKITRGMVGGQARNIYPDFDQIDEVARRGLTWTAYADLWSGWNYDKRSGFGEADSYNPDALVWFGVFLAEPAFADQAIELFGPAGRHTPGLVDVLDEARLTTFWADRAHAHEAAESINTEALNAIRAKYGIPTGAITQAQIAGMDPADRDSLDPDHPAPGIVANRRKTWPAFKAARGLSLR